MMKKLYLGLGLILSLVACNQKINKDITASNLSPITIQSNIDLFQTRAPILSENGGGRFSDNDKFDIFISPINNSTPNSFTIINNKDTFYWENISQARGQSQVKVSAIYPASAVVDNANTVSWTVFNKAIADADVLYAYPKNTNTKSVIILDFKHLMHKLSINLASAEGVNNDDLNNVKVSINNVNTNCTINALTGAISQVNGTNTLKQSGKSVSFLFPPQQIGSMQISIEFASGTIVTKNLSDLIASATNFESGKRTIINLTVSKQKISIGNVSISDWEEGQSISANIEI